VHLGAVTISCRPARALGCATVTSGVTGALTGETHRRDTLALTAPMLLRKRLHCGRIKHKPSG
jgi:hypothetical protein